MELEQTRETAGVTMRLIVDHVRRTCGEDFIIGLSVNDEPDFDVALSREVMDDYLKFRREVIAWEKVSEQAYLTARLLPFKYAEPSGG